MRITSLQIILTTLFSVSLYAKEVRSQTVLEKVINISVNKKEVKKVLLSITGQTGVKFIYSSDMVDIRKKISCNFETRKLGEFFEQALAPLGIGYKVIDEQQVLLFPSTPSAPQDPAFINISGRVVNEKNEPMTGVSIRLKGSGTGTATGTDGRFTISVPDVNSVLVISHVDYQEQEIVIANQTSIEVRLIALNSQLDQVVVIGYGSTQRKNLTYAISKIDEKDLKDIPITSFQQGLEGKVAGLQITAPSGKPGSLPFLRLRGVSSVNLASDPLYVLDGVVVLNLDGLNADDIASVEVLKDASAQIYGVNGSNGVILVTTKRGKDGKNKMTFTNTFGATQVTHKLSVLGTDDYLKLMNDVYTHAGLSVPPAITNPPLSNTDWQKQTYRTAFFHNNELQFSGGNGKFNYFLSGGYQREEGIISPADFKRYSLRSNLDFNVSEKFKVGTNIGLTRTSFFNVPDNNRANQGGVVLSALTSTPTSGTQPNPDGSYPYGNPTQALDNPLAITGGQTDKTYTSKVIANVFGELQLPYNLRLRSSVGVDFQQSKNETFTDPITTGNGRANNGLGGTANSDELIWVNTNTLTYNKHFAGNQSLEVVAGTEARKSAYTYSALSVKNYGNDIVTTLNNASTVVSFGSTKSQWAFFSYFARAIYNYDDRYIFSGAFRADGSSRFPPEHRTANFYSLSGAWRISNESFMKQQQLFNDLKLRASYGITGNASLGDFQYLATYGAGANYPFDDLVNAGVSVTGIQNNNLKWEKTKQLNIGLDLAVLHNRLSFTADYYIRRSVDLLFNKPLPINTGFASALLNIGQLENKGIELSLTSQNIRSKNGSWSTTLLFTSNRNKVLALDGSDQTAPFNSAGVNNGFNIQKVGQPVSSFYGYIAKGVDPATGDMIFADISGPAGKPDGVITDDDRTVIGNALPKFTASISNTVTLKNWDLSFLFDGVFGNKIFDASRIELEGMLDSRNSLSTVLNRWTTPGQHTDMPRAIFGDPAQNTRNSTRWIEDGSFVKLRFVTLGYTFNQLSAKSFLKGARAYVSGRNLATFTSYSGYDPEISRDGGNNNQMGIDYGTYPQTRTYVLGINLNF
ncbi:MAG TPA: TonB-dependent receptor [Puia sp.]|nr:TonB-dependent receptor [Puia sp.]